MKKKISTINSTFTINASDVAIPTEAHEHCWHLSQECSNTVLIRVHGCCYCGEQGRSYGKRVPMKGHGKFAFEVAWTKVQPYTEKEYFKESSSISTQYWTYAGEK